MLASRSPYHEVQHQTIILILLFVAMVCSACGSGIRCRRALHVSRSMPGAWRSFPVTRSKSQVAANAVFAAAVILSLFGSYVLERETRMNYLLLLRGRFQRRVLDAKSHRDPLTGLRNRRSLDEAIATCNQSGALGEELAVVLLDIDHFKSFNDTAGHQAGDVCLKRVAGIIQSELRDCADDAFRFGGEEFILVLRKINLATATRISEQIRRAIEEAAIPHPALAMGEVVTVSMGVASAILSRELRAGLIISAADAALYAAKRNGRNRYRPACHRPRSSRWQRKVRVM